MPDDNIPSQEIPWYRYTAVFRDVMIRKQLLQKSSHTNHLSAFFSAYMLVVVYLVNFLSLGVVVKLLALMLEFECMLMTCCWFYLHAVISVKWLKFVRMRWSKLWHDESLLKISTAGRYSAVFSKPTVSNTITFKTAIFFWYRYTAQP